VKRRLWAADVVAAATPPDKLMHVARTELVHRTTGVVWRAARHHGIYVTPPLAPVSVGYPRSAGGAARCGSMEAYAGRSRLVDHRVAQHIAPSGSPRWRSCL
jgi:hypothetical protein